MYIHRTIEQFILKASKSFPVLMITGARQVGKTTLLKYLSKDRRKYVTLDDPMLRNLANDDPDLFLQRFQSPLLIDEIQYAPGLLPHIKMKVDQSNETGLYWLTGSQQFHMMKGVSESLAGRIAIINLFGFTLRERLKTIKNKPFLLGAPQDNSEKKIISLTDFYRLIWRGNYPSIVTKTEMDRDLFYSSYIQTYLQRDIRDLAKVGSEMSFLKFIRAAAARTGQLLNIADLARDADVAPNTAKSWVSILEASGIIILLQPFHSNVTKRIVKTPKLHFLDTGLCSYLAGWTSSENLEIGAMSGAILETWVVSEIMKSYYHNGLKPEIYFYRDRDGREIDLLIFQNNKVYPIEIKKSASPHIRDVKAFSLLKKMKMDVGKGMLICFIKEIIPISSDVDTFPVSWI